MFFRLVPLALAACSLLLLGCPGREEEHLLFRAGYGPDPWSRARLSALGPAAYTEEQLRPESIRDGRYETLEAKRHPVVLRRYRRIRRDAEGDELRNLLEARILRAVVSRRQLRAVLIDFWFDHFNVYGGGARQQGLVPYERRHIAPHVLGRFEDLLVSVVSSPALLHYLDNDLSRAGRLNENFSRELLELHTLGSDGPFTETDVREVARVFTGWSVDREADESRSGFVFRPEDHDGGAKTVLGGRLPGGDGMEEGLRVLRRLARHPATAEHLSRKLVRHFVSEDPPESLVRSLAATWMESGGDLRRVMRALLLSPEFRLAPLSGPPRVKRPFVLLAGLARALGVRDEASVVWIRRHLRRLGERPYLARSPDGLPDASADWAGHGMLLVRLNVLRDVALGRSDLSFGVPRTPRDEDLVDAWSARLFVRAITGTTRAAVLRYLAGLPPELRRDRERVSREALSLLLASPEYLTH